MTVTVPFRLHRRAQPDGQRRSPAPAPSGPATPSQAPPQPPRRTTGPVTPELGPVRIGGIGLRSAAAYLLVWAGVLFAVEVLVFCLTHLLLGQLGVLGSVSRAAATVLDDEVPESGVLPVLELGALLPWVLAVSAALAVLWLLTSLSLVLVHNCVCALTGGPRVRLR